MAIQDKNTACLTSYLTKEEADKIVAALEEGKMERCLKAHMEEKHVPYNGYKSKEDWITDRLCSTTGSDVRYFLV